MMVLMLMLMLMSCLSVSDMLLKLIKCVATTPATASLSLLSLLLLMLMFADAAMPLGNDNLAAVSLPCYYLHLAFYVCNLKQDRQTISNFIAFNAEKQTIARLFHKLSYLLSATVCPRLYDAAAYMFMRKSQ